ncbi:hypothetical protein [Aureibaculum luteum]|uniref:hypothetical protein n=1 Tax=Aureibaculum luteum TaxID=1548456 RepID=UPI000E48421C|nr:hypothetical protein [Aureibaculum luteum]
MYNDNWSSKFLKDKLKEFDSIKTITASDSNLLKIERKKGESFLTFTMSLELIELNDIEEIVNYKSDIKFITNIKKEYKISGSAMNFLNNKRISFGGMGDLMRFANKENNSLQVDKEFEFVQRGLNQHNKVKSIERLDNKRIKIERIVLNDVIAVMNNDYELGTESVRSYKARFNDFKIMISTNPNARISTEANTVASSLSIDICTWGELLGKLNTFWN